MKQLIFTFLTVILCLSFNEGKCQNKDWTLLVYMVGSDLESGSEAGTTDIQEMLDAGTTDYVNVVVLTGGANKNGWRTPRTWLINNGQQTELPFQPSITNMADPKNITDFINWGTQNYPAQSMMLTFWNHGGDIRGYGFDEISNKQLTVPQIQQAIASSNFIQNNNQFDVIGFDACLMATLEVQSSLQNFGKYYVGSEETEPGHGWNYTPIIQAMESGNALFGDQIGRIIVDEYKAQSESEGTQNVTLGVMDLYYIPDVESALETLFTKIKQESKVRSLQRARGKAEEYSKSIATPAYSEDMVDIGDMMKQLKAIDPSLQVEADSVLAAINRTVIHNRKDMTRPLATGISMYLPHNVLVDKDETTYLLNNTYTPIDFSAGIKDFIQNTYVPEANKDKSPPSGASDPNFTFFRQPTSGSTSRNGMGSDSVSAIRVSHANDLEQVQVVLIEAFVGYPNEFIMLGSTYPDTMVMNADGTETYAYKWDGLWLGINGYPAYISDLHDFEVEEQGVTRYYTRIHIPAILNPGDQDEKDIILSYRYDENFNTVLESIVPEVYGDTLRITPKERINLKPGDRVQLLYESFNEVTDEEFFVVDDNAIITIVNGNQDLHLEYDQLEEGSYHIGYVLMDHAQNDTIIFDEKVFMVVGSSVENSFTDNNIILYPNPVDHQLFIEQQKFSGKEYSIRLYDLNGKLYYEQKHTAARASINTEHLPSGYYKVELISNEAVFGEKLIIQH